MEREPNPLVVEFFRYNLWANLALLDACSALNPEQLDSSGQGCYGSIYATLAHIIRGEASYYRRLTGNRLNPPFAWEDTPPTAALRPYAEQVGTALMQAAGQVQLADIVYEQNDGEEFSYRAVDLLIQAIDHGVEHRTNITTILVQIGVQPPEIDGWGFIMSK